MGDSVGLAFFEHVLKGYSTFTLATATATTPDIDTGTGIVKLPKRGVLYSMSAVPGATATGPLRIDLGVTIDGSLHSLAAGWLRGHSNFGENVYWHGLVPFTGRSALWAIARNDTGGAITYVLHWSAVVP